MSIDITQAQKELEQIIADAQEGLARAKQIDKALKKEEAGIKETAGVLESKLGKSLDTSAFMEFFKKPYVSIPQGKNKLLVAVPKFVKNFQVGWLWKETDSYFIYQLDQYSAWLGDAPADLLQEIEFEPQFNATVQGNRIEFDRADREAIKKKLGHLISEGTLTDTDAVIKKGRTFDVIAEMVKSGCLPFKAMPVSKDDLRAGRAGFSLKPHQVPIADKFLETGAVGAFVPTGGGKSFIAMYAMDRVKGRKLLFVPNNTLKEQWYHYLETHAPHLVSEVSIHTYNANSRQFDGEYALTVFDECHRLPAETFSRLALIRTKYRLGLSASPHREDGREHYIFALTGFPVGLNWSSYMAETGRSYHPIYVHIVPPGREAKLRKLRELLNPKKRTFIFSDSIELGKEIAKRFDVPYVSGETSNRMQVINDHKVVAISRVGDEGVSVKDLEQVIEVDFLGGSRRQELQRTGRLMHSEEAGRHDIIMTEREMQDHGKRIWALQEKGFTVKVLA